MKLYLVNTKSARKWYGTFQSLYARWKRSACKRRSCIVKLHASTFLCQKNCSCEIICEDRLQLRTVSFDSCHSDILVYATICLIEPLLSFPPIIHFDISESAQCEKDVPLFRASDYSMTRVAHENRASRKRFDVHCLLYTEMSLQPATAYEKRNSCR